LKKISFNIVNYQVNKLFDTPLEENETVEERVEQIEKYIEACGWDIDEFEKYNYYGELN
jgi:hypothetical protein